MDNSIWTLNPTGRVADGLGPCRQPFTFAHGHTRATCNPLDEPPGADPHAGRCGEGRLEAGPYPIMRLHGTQGVNLFLQTSYGRQRFDLRLVKICIGNTPR